MTTQSSYDDDDDGDATRSKTPTTHDSEVILPAAQPESSSEQLQIAVDASKSTRGGREEGVDDNDEEEEDDDELAEEDAWLVAGHFFDDTERERDPEKYVPQLMDARTMRQLRSRLRKSEQQIETCGKMREFTPRKPAVSPRSHGCRRNSSHRAPHQRDSAYPDWINGSNSNNEMSSCIGVNGNQQPLRQQQQTNKGSLLTSGSTRAFLTAASSTAALQTPSASHKKQDFAAVLRRELRQLRQMDVVCSVKPSERTGGPETYEKLAELMAFMRVCQVPPVQDLQAHVGD